MFLSLHAGIDLKPEVPPGGTWLGLSTKFTKIAALLNVVQPTAVDPSKKSRGTTPTPVIGHLRGTSTTLLLKLHVIMCTFLFHTATLVF